MFENQQKSSPPFKAPTQWLFYKPNSLKLNRSTPPRDLTLDWLEAVGKGNHCLPSAFPFYQLSRPRPYFLRDSSPLVSLVETGNYGRTSSSVRIKFPREREDATRPTNGRSVRVFDQQSRLLAQLGEGSWKAETLLPHCCYSIRVPSRVSKPGGSHSSNAYVSLREAGL